MRWRLTHVEDAAHPPVLHWTCGGCRKTRYQYADCTNVETMIHEVLSQNLRLTGATLDLEDAVSHLRMEALRLYVSWRPEVGLSFESYGFGLLRRRTYDIYRSLLGRNGEKPLAYAVSFEVITGDEDGDGWPIEPEDPLAYDPADLRVYGGKISWPIVAKRRSVRAPSGSFPYALTGATLLLRRKRLPGS
jgi:hypothetical protein